MPTTKIARRTYSFRGIGMSRSVSRRLSPIFGNCCSPGAEASSIKSLCVREAPKMPPMAGILRASCQRRFCWSAFAYILATLFDNFFAEKCLLHLFKYTHHTERLANKAARRNGRVHSIPDFGRRRGLCEKPARGRRLHGIDRRKEANQPSKCPLLYPE